MWRLGMPHGWSICRYEPRDKLPFSAKLKLQRAHTFRHICHAILNDNDGGQRRKSEILSWFVSIESTKWKFVNFNSYLWCVCSMCHYWSERLARSTPTLALLLVLVLALIMNTGIAYRHTAALRVPTQEHEWHSHERSRLDVRCVGHGRRTNTMETA